MANVSNDDYTSYNEYKAGIFIWKIVPPILILFGTVGNGLSILVLTRRSIRTSTTALYLTVLAFSDLLVLYSGLLRQWLRYLFETDVRHVSEFGCKLNIWLVYSSLDFSAWILLLVTLERVISAWLPHNARSLCTKKSAIALLISVGVFILFLNAHLLYGMASKYTEDENGNQQLEKCVEIDDAYKDFFNVTWPWIDLCAFCVIPFSVIVIGNGLILFKVLKSQKKVKSSRVVPSVQGGSRQQTTASHGSKQSSMTAMLFTLNVVFLLSTSPISIYNVGYTYWEKDATEHGYAVLDMWWAVVNMLMYTNNSLNFLLYCLSGTKFRGEVIRIFTSLKQGANTNTQAPPSNYSRTKFDTPSPALTPRHSALTVNTSFPLPNSLHMTEMTGLQNGNGDPNGENYVAHSNNSLHPSDALRIVNNMSSFKDSTVNKEDSIQSNGFEVSETIVLDNYEGCVMVKSQMDVTGDNDNEKKAEAEHISADNSVNKTTNDVETEVNELAHASKTDTNSTEETLTRDDENLDTKPADVEAYVSNITSSADRHKDNMNTGADDSNV